MADRIGVLGAGGMGSAFAAALTVADAEVVLIGRGGEHVRAVAERGLTILRPDGGTERVRVPAAPYATDLPACSLDILIVLTKTYDTAEACAAVRPGLAADGVAVSLQNGLGNDAVLAAAFGGSRSLVGVTTVGATVREPGVITVSGATGGGRSVTQLGALGAATAAPRGDAVAAVLSAAGLPAAHVADLAAPLWGKLAMAVMSPVSAVLGMTVGAVWSRAEGQSLVRRMFYEVVDVAEQQGVRLDRSGQWAHAEAVFAATGEHHTSMCTDVLQGRRTELAWMAGAVRELAASAGLAVPVHDTVLSLLAVLGVDISPRVELTSRPAWS